jgi:hypothetical protein
LFGLRLPAYSAAMIRRGNNGPRNGTRQRRKRRGAAFRAFERFVLSIGMGMIALVIERRLLKALRGGGFKAAPRTAAEHDEYLGEPPPEVPREGELTASRHEVVEGAGT